MILERSKNREYFFSLIIRLSAICLNKGIKLVIENPDSGMTFLRYNFIFPPTLVDRNRTLRGDYFTKPTAYWFLNCTPTYGRSYQKPKIHKTIRSAKSGIKAGICSEERSMISPDYARNFICDFILGKEQKHSQLSLF